MSELTRFKIQQLQAAHLFLEALADTGVWFPEPTITLGESGMIKFIFSEYDLPDAWMLSSEARQKPTVDRFKAAARAIGGRWMKNDPKASTYDDSWYVFTNDQKQAGLKIVLVMERDMVCERVQTGTEKVTIPAIQAQPERVEERPVYERECKPLFRDTEREIDRLADELEAQTVVDAEIVS